MIKVLWVVGAVTAGFLFSKAIYTFAEFVLQAIKNSEEDR
jgi:beta-lactamase regulating signal transducer with metallopeptidase domain